MRAGVIVFIVMGCHAPLLPTSTLDIGTPRQHTTPTPLARGSETSTMLVQNTVTSTLPKGVSELMRYSPVGVEIALVVNPAQIKTGSIWSSYGSTLEDMLNQDPTFTDFVKEANWNPLEQTTLAYMALTDLEKPDPSVVIVLRGNKLKNVQDSLGKDASMTQTKYKGSLLYTDPGSSFTITFPTTDVVLFGNTTEVKEALDSSAAPKDMTALLSNVDTSTGMFGAFYPGKQSRKEINAEIPEGFPNMDSMSGINFSLGTSKGIDFISSARFLKKEDASSARLFFGLALASQEDQWKDEGLWPYFSTMKIETNQSDLIFSWKLAEKDALAFLEIFAGPSKGNAAKKKHKSNLGGKL
jgi:hypothetical protein